MTVSTAKKIIKWFHIILLTLTSVTSLGFLISLLVLAFLNDWKATTIVLSCLGAVFGLIMLYINAQVRIEQGD